MKCQRFIVLTNFYNNCIDLYENHKSDLKNVFTAIIYLNKYIDNI